MALAETIFVDKCEVVSFATTYSSYRYSDVQVRTATVITKDSVEIAKSFHRKTLNSGIVAAGSTSLTPTNISGEEPIVQSIANVVWTADAKEAYRSYLVGIRSEGL